MADYQVTNEEFYELLDGIFNEVETSSDEEKKIKKQIVFSAFFNDYCSDDTNNKESVEIWDNNVDAPSEFLVGKKCIIIKDSILALVKASINAGFVDVLFKGVTGTTLPILIGTCAFELYELFRNASELDDRDFCVYFQAMTHHKEHGKQGFSLSELKSWLPKDSNITCNMHNSTWVCDYYNADDDSCDFCDDGKIKAAMTSLENKKLIIKKKKDDGTYRYHFKY